MCVCAQLVLAVLVIFVTHGNQSLITFQEVLPKKIYIQFGRISICDVFLEFHQKIIKQTFSRHNHLGSSQWQLIGASQAASVHSNIPPASGMSAMLDTENVNVQVIINKYIYILCVYTAIYIYICIICIPISICI